MANLALIVDATASAPFEPKVCGSPHGAVPRFEVCAGIGIAGGKNQLELWSPTCRAEGRGDARACKPARVRWEKRTSRRQRW